MKDANMKTFLRTLKAQKDLFAVPEPDADFEKRLMKSLHSSPEWQRTSLLSKWRDTWSTLLKIEITTWRLAACAIVLFVAFGGLRFIDRKNQPSVAQAPSSAIPHPVVNSILERGGEKALQAWVAINGDLAATDAGGAPEINTDQQKRVLAELEKKWAPAL